MNPATNRRGPELAVPQLQAAAAEMRAMDIVSIYRCRLRPSGRHAFRHGHRRGALSERPQSRSAYPAWPDRDRVFWSAGHKAPALYVALGRAGYFPLDDVVLLRQLGSRL